jgi:hypothetical protein
MSGTPNDLFYRIRPDNVVVPKIKVKKIIFIKGCLDLRQINYRRSQIGIYIAKYLLLNKKVYFFYIKFYVRGNPFIYPVVLIKEYCFVFIIS